MYLKLRLYISSKRDVVRGCELWHLAQVDLGQFQADKVLKFSLGFSLLICKMGSMLIPAFLAYCEI